MALVDWSSAEQCGWWAGATNTSSMPLVRPGSNIMLRLLTLTFSQPGYRLLMLMETAGQRGSRLGLHRGVCALALPPNLCSGVVLSRDTVSVPTPLLLQGGLCVCAALVLFCAATFPRNVALILCLLLLPCLFPVLLCAKRLTPCTASPRLGCHVPLVPSANGRHCRSWEEKGRGISSLLTACCFPDTNCISLTLGP